MHSSPQSKVILYSLYSIFLLHFILSSLIYDIYTIDRIMVTSLISFSLIATLIFNINLFRDNYILSNRYFILFIAAIVLAFISPHINSFFEVEQQVFISISYALILVSFTVYKKIGFRLTHHMYIVIFITVASTLFLTVNLLNTDNNLLQTIRVYFNNIRILNHLQTIIIPSLGLLLLIIKSKKSYLFVASLLVLNIMLLIETGARGSIYAISIAYLLFTLTNLSNKSALRHIKELLFLAVLASILYYLFALFLSNGSNSEHIGDFSLNGRMLIYTTILPKILDPNFIFTPMGFSTQDIAVTHFLHPHNIFLYMFMGLGTLGLIAFIGVTYLYVINALKRYFKHTSLVKRYMLITICSVLIHSMVSGLYITPLTSILFLSYLLVIAKHYSTATSSPNLSTTKFIINVVIVVMVATLAMTMLIDNIKLKHEYDYTTEEIQDSNKTKKYRPGIMLYSDLIYQTKKVNLTVLIMQKNS